MMELQANVQLSRQQAVLLLTAMGDGNYGGRRRGMDVPVHEAG
jgi:hypothetical protein